MTKTFDFIPTPHKVSWENLGALLKVLGDGFDVGYREDGEAFVVTVRPGSTLPPRWMDLAAEAFLEADAAIQAKKAALKVAMQGWVAPVLPEPTKLTKKLAKQIDRYLKEVAKNVAAEDFGMAQCYASDAADLIKIMVEVDAGHQATAYRLAENLDTVVRENIPEDVWNWMRAA